MKYMIEQVVTVTVTTTVTKTVEKAGKRLKNKRQKIEKAGTEETEITRNL